MTPVTFTVYGDPQSKGSMRGFNRGGKIIVTSDNPSLAKWEAMVRVAAQTVAERSGHRLFEAAVCLDVVFYLLRPKSVSRRLRPFPTTRPDADKAARAILDPLKGIVFRDDAQVVALRALKLYTDGPSKAVVTVRQVLTTHDLTAFTSVPYEVAHV